MSKERMIYIVVAVSLLVFAGLVIHQTNATAKVTSSDARILAPQPAAAEGCPFSAADLKSLRAEYQIDEGIWLPRTDRGAAGQEGGLSALGLCSPANSR